MTDLRSRYAKLRALAEDQEGTPEGDLAAHLAASMLEAYPELQVPVEAEAKLALAYRHAFDRVLLVQVADFLELGAYRVGRRRTDGKGWRWREALELRGPQALLELAAGFYRAHRRRMDEILEWTAVGYVVGAFPVDRDGDGEDRAPLTLAQLQALQGGHGAGRAHQEARLTPESHRLTDGG